MTTLIQEMLKDGITTPNHNPYSSPILLVQKKKMGLDTFV